MKVFIALFSTLLFISQPAFADITMPTVTRVTFLAGAKPFQGKVTYKVSCMGWPCHPGENNCTGDGAPEGAPAIAEVYSYTASCEPSPCEVKEPYYLNYRKLDHCNIEGQANGRPFVIKKYGKEPVDFQKCTNGTDGTRQCELTIALPE